MARPAYPGFVWQFPVCVVEVLSVVRFVTRLWSKAEIQFVVGLETRLDPSANQDIHFVPVQETDSAKQPVND
jgi:hypothetical protein